MAVRQPILRRRRSGSPPSPTGHGEHPQNHLKNFHRVLQAYAYAGFDSLYQGPRIIEAACWAHTQRKFHELLNNTSTTIC
jgi:transposase